MKNLTQFLLDLEKKELKKSKTKNGLIITTSQRNELRKDFLQALENDFLDIQEKLDFGFLIGQTAEGVIIAPEHENVPDTIPFKINVKIGNLDYNAFDEIEVFRIEQQEKNEAKAKRERAKAEKIKNDTEIYESKKIMKERALKD